MKYLFCIISLLLSSHAIIAQGAERSSSGILQEIFNKPDSEIDFASAKLAIDKLVDPSIDSDKVLREINGMVNALESGLAPDMMPKDKILSLGAFLYAGGYWNNNQPFQYDFSDPLGEAINSKLLSVYLTTRKGNCISMPILFLILSDRLGLDVSLSIAPLHVLVKFKDPVSGEYFNIEATDRGYLVPDQFYYDKLTITERAIANKLYLQPLTKKQSVAVMAILLSEHLERQGKWRESIEVAELALKHYPNYVYAMIKIGNGYSGLLSRKLAEIRVKGSYTPEEKRYMDNLNEKNIFWFDKAEELGWRPTSREEDEEYLNSVRQRVSQLTKASKGS